MSGTYDSPGYVYDHPGGTYDWLPATAPDPLPFPIQRGRLIQIAEIDLPELGVQRIATEPYCTRPTDDPADALYDGRMAAVTIEEAMWHPVWSQSGTPGTTLSSIEVVNLDGELDGWLDIDAKGASVRLLIVPARASYATAVLIATAKIEQITSDFRRLTVRLQSLTDQIDGDAAVISKRYPDAWYDASFRGKERALALGHVQWAPLRLVLSEYGGMDITDAPFEGLETVYRRGIGVSRSHRELPNDGWWPSQGSTDYPGASHDYPYGAAIGWTEGKIVGRVRGNVRLIGAELVANPDFLTSLTGWDVSAGAGSSVTWSTHRAVMIAAADEHASIEQTIATVAGQRYCLTLDTEGFTGAISVSVGGAPAGAAPNVPPVGLTVRYGRQRFFFVASGSTTAIKVGIDASPSHAGASHHVALVSVRACARIDTVAEVFRFVAERLGHAVEHYDLAAADALQASAYRVAYWADGRVTAGDLLRAVGASYGAGVVRDAAGRISLARLATPGTPTRLIGAGSIRDVEISLDLAPGLSDRLLYARNYAVHSASDLVESVPAALAGELMTPGRIVRASTSPSVSYLEAARAADPIVSCLVEQSHAQAEIDRLCGLYSVQRRFYSVAARLTAPEAAALLPGQTVRIVWTRYGLSSGRDLMVVLKRASLIDGRIDLVLWG